VHETLFKFVQICHFYCMVSRGQLFTRHSVDLRLCDDDEERQINKLLMLFGCYVT